MPLRSTLEDRFQLMSLEGNGQQYSLSNDCRGPQTSLIPAVEADPLVYRLLRPDTKTFLAENISDIHEFWILLLEKTFLPDGILYTDARITAAFQSVDTLIDSQPLHLSRLAYVQLSYLYSSLKRIISNNRRDYKIDFADPRKDATIAVDIYANVRAYESRSQAHVRLRRSRRFQDLGGRFPLLLALHSKAADWTVYVPYQFLVYL